MSKLIDKKSADEGYQRWQPPQMVERIPPGGVAVEGSQAGLLTAEQLEKVQAQAYKEAWDAGFSKGREAGLAAGQQDIAQRAALLDSLVNALDQPFEEMDASVEEALVDLAMTLAQALVRRELRADPGQVVAVVQEALAALPVASRHVRVCLHPDDVSMVSAALIGRDSEGVSERGWQLQEDPTLKRGDCVVLSENSQINASMEKRLAAVVAQLSGGEREQDAGADRQDSADASTHASTETSTQTQSASETPSNNLAADKPDA